MLLVNYGSAVMSTRVMVIVTMIQASASGGLLEVGIGAKEIDTASASCRCYEADLAV